MNPINVLPSDIQNIIYRYVHEMSLSKVHDEVNTIVAVNNDDYEYSDFTVIEFLKCLSNGQLKHITNMDDKKYLAELGYDVGYDVIEEPLFYIGGNDDTTDSELDNMTDLDDYTEDDYDDL
jgi:hypothetical protein